MRKTSRMGMALVIASFALGAGAADPNASKSQAGGSLYIIGHVAEAAKDHIAIEGESKPMTKLKVNADTKVMLEGREVSASELPEGAPVFAAFDRSHTATVVRADAPRASSGGSSAK